MISLGKSKHSAPRRDDDNKRQPLPIGHFLLLAVIGAGAFFIRYWFNFIDLQHLNTYGACDASEYMRNAQAMLGLRPDGIMKGPIMNPPMIGLPDSFWSDSWAVLQGTASPQVIQKIQMSLSPLKDLQIAGPIYPAFLALCYALSMAPFAMTNWQAPVLAQCITSALSCVFIALAGSHAFSRNTGYVAGFLAAIYPGFIVNSGRLYSESFATFLLSIILYITCRNFTVPKSGISSAFFSNLINGAVAAALQFTRSLMFVLSLALLPVVLFQQGIKKGLFGVVALIIGFTAVALPWLAFQKLAYGQANLIVDRVGHYNFFIGNNVDTAGWLSFPYPDGRRIEEKSLPQLGQEAYKRSPGRYIRLLQDKPLRLFKFPWNDFRASMGAISFNLQVLLHQVILLFAGIGVILSYLVKHRKSGIDTDYERTTPSAMVIGPSNSAKTFILFVFLLHCAYMLFITVPRYNLTAMPEVILFAAGGISSIASLALMRRGGVAAMTLLISAGFLFGFLHMELVPVVATLVGGQHATIGLIIQCVLRAVALLSFALGLWLAIGALTERELGDERRRISHASGPRLAVIFLTLILIPMLVLPVNADGRPLEWSVRLNPGQVVSQKLIVPADFDTELGGRQPYLLIDANGLQGLSQTQIEINGKPIDAPLIPSIAMCDEFARYQDVGPASYMREGEWIFDCLTQSAGMHNADLRQWFMVPIPADILKPGAASTVSIRQMSTSGGPKLYGAYPTYGNNIYIPSINSCSWEKAFYGVENEHGLSDPRYDIKIPGQFVEPSNKDLSYAPGKQTGRLNIHVLAGPSVPYNDKIATVERFPPVPPHVAILSSHEFPPSLLRDSKQAVNLTANALPPSNEKSLWIVRVVGKVRRNTGTATLNIGFKGYTADKNQKGDTVAYASPWGTDMQIGPEWIRIDVSVPIAPGKLRAPLNKVVATLMIGHAQKDGVAAEGVSEFKDVRMQIMRLPNNPLQATHKVY